uniref:Uncharacterized protein n=1 Tax=Craspedostauros australis TaxID=1486917 RepID=A0A7R9WTH2_9STRA
MASNSPTNTSVLFPAQDWDCYGSTRVDLLVLRSADGKSPDVNMNLNPSANARGQNSREDPSLSRRGLNNEESIAAVAPYTSTGVSVRDISHKGWASSRLRDRIITLQLGVLEVIYQQVVEDISENEYEENNSTNKSDGPKSADDRTSSSTKESQSSNDKQMTFPSRFRNSAGKILHHMQFNAKLLRDSVREDFSGRTYAAGKRIVDKFGSTAENMNKFALKIIYQTTGFFGDDDEDGGGGSSRRGGGW